jgi:hypothetical protein
VKSFLFTGCPHVIHRKKSLHTPLTKTFGELVTKYFSSPFFQNFFQKSQKHLVFCENISFFVEFSSIFLCFCQKSSTFNNFCLIFLNFSSFLYFLLKIFEITVFFWFFSASSLKYFSNFFQSIPHPFF